MSLRPARAREAPSDAETRLFEICAVQDILCNGEKVKAVSVGGREGSIVNFEGRPSSPGLTLLTRPHRTEAGCKNTRGQERRAGGICSASVLGKAAS